MGSDQLNKKYGRITMDQHGGPHTPERHPTLSDRGGTPNQKTEREAIILIDSIDTDDEPIALARSWELVSNQKKLGHQRIASAHEFFTNSHAPIWYRGMGSMTITAFDHRQRSGQWAALFDECMEWWSRDTYLRNLCEVPSGALHENVVSIGARFRPGGDDQVRDVVHGRIAGRTRAHCAGVKFWRNALIYQDTFAATLVDRLVEKGAFLQMPAPIRPVTPSALADFTVSRYADGHVTTAPFLASGDPAHLWVRYSTGETGTGPTPADLSGQPLHFETVPSYRAA